MLYFELSRTPATPCIRKMWSCFQKIGLATSYLQKKRVTGGLVPPTAMLQRPHLRCSPPGPKSAQGLIGILLSLLKLQSNKEETHKNYA